MKMNTERKIPSFRYSLLVMLAIIALTSVGIVVFNASITTMFLLSWLIVVPAAMKLGYTNDEIEAFNYTFCWCTNSSLDSCWYNTNSSI